MSRNSFLFLSGVLLIVLSCKPAIQTFIESNTLTTTKADDPFVIPTDTSHESFSGLRKKALIKSFYDSRQGQPAWTEDPRGMHLSDSLAQFIANVRYLALPSSRYHLPELKALQGQSDLQGLTRKELLLTDAFILLTSDLRSGLVSSSEDITDSVKMSLLNTVLETGILSTSLRALEPVRPGYVSLKNVLKTKLDDRLHAAADSNQHQKEIELISINLERWRRERHSTPEKYIIVNIPSFTLDFVESDSVILTSRVIVGTPEKQTPVLSSLIECISIYPYWHVPRKIAVEEYLPVIQKDTSFISRNHFDVLDRKGKILDIANVPWEKYNKNYFPVSLRQREGTENSLGVIKFVFDNPYAVYLHDTNAKRLFNSRNRAFSHGCVRMEKAETLAHLLVTGKPGMESKAITGYLKEKQQRWIDLKKPVPIYLRYFTCEYRNGVLYTYDDIYSMDKEIRQALFPESMTAEL